MAFTWIPFYKELAQKLLKFRNDRAPLIEWIYGNLDGFIGHLKDAPDGRRVADIDPFSVYSIFNRGLKDDNRVSVCSKVKDFLGISAPLPSDFNGIPIVNAMQSNFIAFEDRRKNGDVERLWQVFEAAVKDEPIQEKYDALKDQYLIKYNLTIGLFWVRPDKFLPLDGNCRRYLKTIGISVANKGQFVVYEEYARVMKALDSVIASGKEYFSNYAEFSDAAYTHNQKEHKNQKGQQSDDAASVRYWLLAPGENASKWERCKKEGIACIGWDELGDLKNYASLNDLRNAMKAEYGKKSSNYKNDVRATWDFCNEIKVGDIIFAKRGTTHIIGRGTVTSDYYFDDNYPDYKSVRKVEWDKEGEWKTKGNQPTKTLTDITNITDYAKKLTRLVEGINQAPSSTDGKRYWWLVSSPKIWALTDMKVGEEQEYTFYNENGKPRRIYKNFIDAQVGDILFGYCASPIRQIVCLLTVTKKTEGKTITFRNEESLPSPIDYSVLKSTPELAEMEFMRNYQGSFFKVTPEEYDVLMEIIRGDNPLPKEGVIEKYTMKNFLKEVFIGRNEFTKLENLLLRKKNIILCGAPGVGKTFAAKRLAYAMMGEKNDGRVMQVQFHQNYTYEDFVMGYKPNEDGGFDLKNGLFYRFCKRAAADRDHQYFFIIDEINRGNLSKIFGELLMLIEGDYRDKPIQLPYRDELFAVPSNLYIIGMMNTADRSLAMIDYALRRRFGFYEMAPGFSSESFDKYVKDLDDSKLNKLVGAIKNLNTVIEKDDSLGPGFCIGHSYLCNLSGQYDLSSIVEYDIIPMLREYWFDNNDKFNQEAQKLREAIK